MSLFYSQRKNQFLFSCPRRGLFSHNERVICWWVILMPTTRRMEQNYSRVILSSIRRQLLDDTDSVWLTGLACLWLCLLIVQWLAGCLATVNDDPTDRQPRRRLAHLLCCEQLYCASADTHIIFWLWWCCVWVGFSSAALLNFTTTRIPAILCVGLLISSDLYRQRHVLLNTCDHIVWTLWSSSRPRDGQREQQWW